MSEEWMRRHYLEEINSKKEDYSCWDEPTNTEPPTSAAAPAAAQAAQAQAPQAMPDAFMDLQEQATDNELISHTYQKSQLVNSILEDTNNVIITPDTMALIENNRSNLEVQGYIKDIVELDDLFVEFQVDYVKRVEQINASISTGSSECLKIELE